MDKIASVAVEAVTLLVEGMTYFCFVGLVIFHIDLEFFWTMGKLAFVTIRATRLFYVISAQRGLDFAGWTVLGWEIISEEKMRLMVFIWFCGGF